MKSARLRKYNAVSYGGRCPTTGKAKWLTKADARKHARRAHAGEHMSTYACDDCGGDAEQWSYDHQDQDELVSEIGHPYSLDLQHYAARCCSCHRRFDAIHGGANA